MRDLGAVWRPCVDLRTLSCVNVCLGVCASLVSVCECVISVWVGGRASSSGLVDVGADSWPCVEFTDRLMWRGLAAARRVADSLSRECVCARLRRLVDGAGVRGFAADRRPDDGASDDALNHVVSSRARHRHRQIQRHAERRHRRARCRRACGCEGDRCAAGLRVTTH